MGFSRFDPLIIRSGKQLLKAKPLEKRKKESEISLQDFKRLKSLHLQKHPLENLSMLSTIYTYNFGHP